MTNDRPSRFGFTLYELLVVMMILAILVTLVIGLGRPADQAARRHRALADLALWHDALHRYYLQVGGYPDARWNGSATNLLSAGVTIGGNTTVRLADGATSSLQLHAVDPWGRFYRYAADGTNDVPQSYDLYSTGADAGNPSDDVRFQ